MEKLHTKIIICFYDKGMNENKMVDCCYFYQVGVGITQNLTRENYLNYFDYMHPDGEIYIRRSY